MAFSNTNAIPKDVMDDIEIDRGYTGSSDGNAPDVKAQKPDLSRKFDEKAADNNNPHKRPTVTAGASQVREQDRTLKTATTLGQPKTFEELQEEGELLQQPAQEGISLIEVFAVILNVSPEKLSEQFKTFLQEFDIVQNPSDTGGVVVRRPLEQGGGDYGMDVSPIGVGLIGQNPADFVKQPDALLDMAMIAKEGYPDGVIVDHSDPQVALALDYAAKLVGANVKMPREEGNDLKALNPELVAKLEAAAEARNLTADTAATIEAPSAEAAQDSASQADQSQKDYGIDAVSSAAPVVVPQGAAP